MHRLHRCNVLRTCEPNLIQDTNTNREGTPVKKQKFNQEKFIAWLEANGGQVVEHFGVVGSQDTEDSKVAGAFARGMREQVGTSGIAEVECSYNRVTIKLVVTHV